MRRLLFLIATLFILTPTVNAEYELGDFFAELPETLYAPPAVNFFSEPTVDEILYNRFETAILDTAVDNALQKSIAISVLNTGVDFDTTDETYNINYLLNIYANVVYNNPQIGNLITGFNVFVESEGSTNIVSIRPMYRAIYNEQTYQSLATDEEKAAYLVKTHNVDTFNNAVKYAYSKAIATDMTEDWQKLLSIHDYLADTITYSDIVANGTEAEIDAYKGNTNYLAWTTYSALVGDRISVCQGYSLAFKLLCDMAGIECGYAISAKHIWNIAECNGNYYHIDVTWDDPTSVEVSDGNGNTYICTSDYVMHKHFLRSDADSTTLHTNEGAWTSNMPECSDSNYHNSLIFGELGTMYFPLHWSDGTFWFEAYRHYLNTSTGIVTHDPAGVYYQVTANDIYEIDLSIYPPKIELKKMHNVLPFTPETNVIAIDGTANTNADFYAAKYTDGGILIDVYKTDITFNQYGEAVTEFPKGYNRLFLFTDNGMKPLAYSK